MELEGAKMLVLPIKTFVSDRHRSIAKWMRTTQKDTTHYYDIWHRAKAIVRKVLKASKEKGCELLAEWQDLSGITYSGVLLLPKLGFQPW